MKIVVITDLDGCLLDPETYDPGEAKPFIDDIIGRGYEIAFNSSKTRLEQLYYRKIWGLENIFSVENGAAVYYPYRSSLNTIVNGIPRREVEDRVKDLKESTKGKLLWLEDLSPADFSHITNLPVDLAPLALEREYSTLFHPYRIGVKELKALIEEIRRRGLNVETGSGRVYIVSGRHDKGISTEQIKEILSRKHRRIQTIGVGDGLNDYPMLINTDYAVVLGNMELYNQLMIVKDPEKLIYVDSRGPRNWYNGVMEAVKKYGLD